MIEAENYKYTVFSGGNEMAKSEKEMDEFRAAMDERLEYVTHLQKKGEIEDSIRSLLVLMRENKPTERGELARRYAIAITDAEKLAAYISSYL